MFTEDEFELLMEGLDSISQKESYSDFTSLMLGGIFSKDGEREEAMNKLQKEQQEREKERELRNRRIILLKAKLIQFQDKAIADLAGQEMKNIGG